MHDLFTTFCRVLLVFLYVLSPVWAGAATAPAPQTAAKTQTVPLPFSPLSETLQSTNESLSPAAIAITSHSTPQKSTQTKSQPVKRTKRRPSEKPDRQIWGLVLVCLALLLIALCVLYGLGAGGALIPRLFYYVGAVIMSAVTVVAAIFSLEFYYGWGALLTITIGLFTIAAGALAEPWILVAAAVIFGILAVIALILGIIWLVDGAKEG